jgi:hypothetical protein
LSASGKGLGRRLLWFAVYWLLGVAVVAGVAFALRALILP